MVSTKYHTHTQTQVCNTFTWYAHSKHREREALDCSIREECAEMTGYS